MKAISPNIVFKAPILPDKMSFEPNNCLEFAICVIRICNMGDGQNMLKVGGWKNSAVKNCPSGSASFDSWQFSTAAGKNWEIEY